MAIPHHFFVLISRKLTHTLYHTFMLISLGLRPSLLFFYSPFFPSFPYSLSLSLPNALLHCFVITLPLSLLFIHTVSHRYARTSIRIQRHAYIHSSFPHTSTSVLPHLTFQHMTDISDCRSIIAST